MSLKYKHIYFDLDGTIIDSSEGVLKSVIVALKRYDLDNYSDELIKKTIIGPPLYEGLKNLTKIEDDEILKSLVIAFREEYSKQGVFQNTLFPNIIEMLDVLKELGCHIEVLTSKPQKFAKLILKQHSIEKYFSKVDGAGEHDKSSSKAAKLSAATIKIRENSIMIGDRVEDLSAAKEAKVDSIAVSYGFDDTSLLQQHSPTYCVDNVMDIAKIISESR